MAWPKNKNKYGINDYNVPSGAIEPYITLVDGDTTYICFFNTPERAIHRITNASGTTTKEKAYGAWDDRASLDYIPIND